MGVIQGDVFLRHFEQYYFLFGQKGVYVVSQDDYVRLFDLFRLEVRVELIHQP